MQIKTIEETLLYWFGPGMSSDLPSEERTKQWFAYTPDVDQFIKENFEKNLIAAKNKKLVAWQKTARGSLALIIILDQFSRNIYRNQAQAFAADTQAINLSLDGIELEFDQQLSLIERVFFYIPLMHSEDIHMQQQSVAAYKSLFDLALPETQAIFKSFYHYAIEHYRVIEEFGRFPYRNKILSRESTPEEQQYLQGLKQ